MLVTARMLQSELSLMASSAPAGISVDLPAMPTAAEPEKVVEVLELDETAVAAELDEIKNAMKSREMLSVQNKPAALFEEAKEPVAAVAEAIPAPVRNAEVHEIIASENPVYLHDKLKTRVQEVSDIIREPAIADLRKGIGVNDRYTFINELFQGDEVAYDSCIKAINGFSNGEEAVQWIRRELKLKLGWDNENPVVHQFDALVKRRFSLT